MDVNYRRINYNHGDESGYCVVAETRGCRVGSFFYIQAYTIEFVFFARGIGVDENYRRKRIGTGLLKYAFLLEGQKFLVFRGRVVKEYQNF